MHDFKCSGNTFPLSDDLLLETDSGVSVRLKVSPDISVVIVQAWSSSANSSIGLSLLASVFQQFAYFVGRRQW